METPTQDARRRMLAYPCTYCHAVPDESCFGLAGDPVYEVHSARVTAYRRNLAGLPPVAPPLPRKGD